MKNNAHMTKDKSKFIYQKMKREGKVTIGNNTTTEMLSSCTIGMKNFFSLKKTFACRWFQDLLTINQLCDKSFFMIVLRNASPVFIHNTNHNQINLIWHSNECKPTYQLAMQTSVNQMILKGMQIQSTFTL